MSKNIAGYLVRWEPDALFGFGGHLKLCVSRAEPEGILLYGRSFTLFPSREAARAAIKRTKDRAKKLGRPWAYGKFQLQEVVHAEARSA